MGDYIPDSEDEEDLLLSPGVISHSKVAQTLQSMPEPTRQVISSELRRTRFFELVPEMTPESLREAYTFTVNDLGDSRQHSTTGDRSTHTEEEGDGIRHNSDQIDNGDLGKIRHDLDRDDIEMLQESSINQSSRRGLRKRNFASTHPYIADQAHWLGLSSINSLNELYHETPDLDAIVRLLNQIYLKKKSRYSSDEKYKAKNFYAFLGKRPGFIKDQELSSQFTEDSSQPSFPKETNNRTESNENNISNDSDSGESDSSILFLNRKNHSIIVDDEDEEPADAHVSMDDPSSTDESEDSDIMVRVGGKFRKERNVLRGTLPESAKRLDLYRSKKSKIDRKKRNNNNYRKGLAIKKSNVSNNRDNILENELMSFVDDNDYYEEPPAFYHNFEPLEYQNDLLLMDTDNADSDESINVFSDISESSNTGIYDDYNSKSFEGDIDNTDFQKIQNGVNEDLRTDYYGGVHLSSKYDDDSDSVIEDNRVDPQFVYPSITRNHKVTGNKRKTNKKSRNAAQTLDKWNPTAVTGNAKRQMSNGSGTGIRKQKLNKRQTKIVGLSSKGFDKVSFGKLRKKRIGSSDKEMNNKKKGYSKVANVIDTSMNPKKSQKDMLITDYYFSRTPNISTTIFEAESTNRFVKTKDTRFSYNQRGILPSHLQYAEKSDKLYEDEISNTIIFDDIDMNKIHSLKFGVCPICNTDSSVIILMGEKYSFTLIDKTDSNVRSEMLLLQLAKLLNDSKIYSNEDLNKEIQQSLKGIIKWFLILQENPSENAWTYLLHILDDMSKVKKKDNISSKLSFFPYFLLLYYIFIQVSQRDISDKQTIELRYTDYNRYCVKYWTLYFQFTDIDSLTNDESLSLNFQSLHFMYLLFQNNDEIWWPVINKALNRLISLRLAPMGIFDMLYYIASLIPPSRCNWSSFYIIYNAHKSDDNSDFHNRFIETIYSLNEKYSWTFEEKLITTIYSTITARKFSNFDDEKTGPELIDILITRDSIPNTSFFEKFMHLLYCYVSSLPYGGNKKRLISKLFTSSHYHYQKGSRSFAMFVNRFNFILLLSQLSDVDLRNQVLDLVQQVKTSNDIKMYNITNEGLQTYSNIAASKSKSLPVDSYQIMVETMIDLYTSLPGIQRIWEQLLINIEKYFLPDINSTFAFNNHFNFFALVRRLEFNKFTDLISVSLVKLLVKAVTNIIKAEQFNISEKNSELIYIVQEKYFSFLHTHMGRFPFSNQLTEDRTTEIIEESIRVWIRCNSLLKEVNWNVLVLQKYPYIGNSYSRERFVLFFYNELLLFTSLSNHIDSIILALLKSLALFFTSPYLALIINSLMKSHHRLFIFKKEHVPEQLTSFQMSNYKSLIASNIIFNLAEDDILSKATKIIYLEELIKSLNEEYNKYFESTSYVEYCRKLVETVQKYCAEFIQSIDEYGSLSRKLGIKHLESNEYRWHILPLKEKLTCLNNEISSAVFFQKDARSILDEYITLESFDLVYHLISIYMKSVTNFQQDKWIFISQLMEYIYSKLLDYKILISDKLYKNFLRSLVDLGSLRRKVEGRFHSYEVYQNKSFIAAFAIFRETYYLYDGYKDRAQIKSTINDFVDMYDDSNTDNYITDLSIPFSSYVLFDIQQPGSEIGGSTVQNTPQDNLNKLKESSDHGYNQLLKIIRPTLSSEFLSTSLPFDISF